MAHAQDVTADNTLRPHAVESVSPQQTTATTGSTPKLTKTRKSGTGSVPATTPRRNSTNSSQHLKTSKQRWQEPKTVDQLAAQINSIATKVLNGEVDMDTARVYSTLARVIAQTISMRVTKARFLKTAPDLTIGDSE